MFWSISTVAVLLLGVLFGFGALTAAVLSAVVLDLFFKGNKTEAADCLGAYPLVGALFTMEKSLHVEAPTCGHLHSDRRTLVPVSKDIQVHPATLLCCGRKRRAECFVTTMVLWVDLVALQLALLHVAAIAFVVSVAPFAIVTNVMLVVLALTCLVNFLSLLFTIYICPHLHFS